jgi:signal transduction histidine kinase
LSARRPLPLRLLAGWAGWAGLGALVALGCLPVLGIELVSGGLALLVVLAAAAVATGAALGWTLAGARRVREALEASRPVPAASVGRLLIAPRVVTLASTGSVAVALLVLGLVRPLSIAPRESALFALATFAALQASGLRAGVAWRSTLGAITDRIAPAAVGVPTRRFLANTFGERLASVAFAVTALVGAALSARVATIPPLGVFVVALLVAAGVFTWGRALGQHVVADLTDLRTYAALAAAGDAWVPESVVPAPPTRMRASSSEPVAEAVERLTRRYGQMALAEERARESVRQARALKTRFMAMMSHDLRSPLNSITGFAEVLSDGLDGPLEAGQQESVAAIRSAAEDLARLVTDILDSARLEAGRLPLEKDWVPLVTLLGNAIGEARARLRNEELSLEPQLEPGLPPLYVDADRVVQALAGILTHVGQMIRRGTIILDVRRAEEAILIDVRAADLRADDAQRIFEALRAVRAPSGQRVVGLGLGLALARGLVEANGGALTYEELPRGGARFALTLPTDGPPR